MRIANIIPLGALILALQPCRSGAQSVPAISVEIAAGAGTHTAVTANTYYRGGTAGMLRVAGTVRLGSAGRVRPVVTVEQSPGCGFGWGCGHKLSCEVAPNGTCRQDFDEPEGMAIAFGVAAVAGNRLVGTLAVGVADYARHAQYIDANTSLRLFWRVSIVADARYIRSTTDSRGERTWFAPVSAGFRFF